MEKVLTWIISRWAFAIIPEQWPREMWQLDLRRMKAHGIETVRVFEFAWSVIEPKDNEWDFSLLDDFLALAAKEGMQVILGNPSVTPPAWLTHAHPEVLNAKMDGTLYRHKYRRHYNYNSPVYRQYVSRVVEKLAHMVWRSSRRLAGRSIMS